LTKGGDPYIIRERFAGKRYAPTNPKQEFTLVVTNVTHLYNPPRLLYDRKKKINTIRYDKKESIVINDI